MDFSSLEDAAVMEMIALSFGKSTSESTLNEAISTLYNRYGRLVFSVAFHLVGDRETAEEITQDVFVRACEGAQSYRSQLSKVSTWLVSIARHRAIDELRRRSVRPERNRVDWLEEEGKETNIGIPAVEGLENQIERSIEQQVIRQMVTDLPVDQRLVLSLAYFKGLSHSQIANTLGEPLGTVKSRIRLAMQKLHDTFLEMGMIEPS
ncbi:MAG: sigma-70 family RNA polymerase sigma factor [Anaerolineaceae bacterium]|nr:sigma-70 family RNA polymerase sigma factor [Anaerolineaceae bacterium]